MTGPQTERENGKGTQERRVKMEIMGRAENGTLSFHNIPVCLCEREVRDDGMTEHTQDHYNRLAHCQTHKYTHKYSSSVPVCRL